jgi:hypothetical protein
MWKEGDEKKHLGRVERLHWVENGLPIWPAMGDLSTYNGPDLESA